jgi:hypothetical protein
MAGSKRTFNYTADNGVVFALVLDESNTEAANGTSANVPAAAARSIIPRPVGMKPRRFFYQSATNQRIISCIVLTPALYAGTPPATIPDTIAGGANTLNFIRRVPESYPGIRWADTGQTDTDAEVAPP